MGIADEGSCLEELDDELFFFDFTALRFSHSSLLLRWVLNPFVDLIFPSAISRTIQQLFYNITCLLF